MRLIVDLGEPLRGDVGVNLCGLQAGVAEHLLHHAQISTPFKHLRGRSVPQ